MTGPPLDLHSGKLVADPVVLRGRRGDDERSFGLRLRHRFRFGSDLRPCRADRDGREGESQECCGMEMAAEMQGAHRRGPPLVIGYPSQCFTDGDAPM